MIAIFTYQLEKAATKFEEAQVPVAHINKIILNLSDRSGIGYVTEAELEMLKIQDNQETGINNIINIM